MNRIYLIASILLAPLMMAATPDSPRDTVLVEAMNDEMERTTSELELEDFSRPYYVSFTVFDVTSVECTGQDGGLLHEDRTQRRYLRADVRVGSYELDNSNSQFQSQFFSNAGMTRLPVGDDYHALRRGMWLTATREAAERRAGGMRDETRLRDGTRVRLMANINLLSELDLAVRLKAEGIGLYRTEFPFLVRDSLPTEDEQVRVFTLLFDRMQAREVTVRTLDVGGDKVLAYFDVAAEPNPELGLRSTRFALRHPEIFDQQLRAMLRAAGPDTRLRVMFPMIGSIDEFREARLRLETCWQELRTDGRVACELPQIGMMVELPAVTEILDAFVREAAFFSIGTNDFVQYMLAADRTNERVAEYYVPHHPAVLRALARIVRTVTAGGRDLSICGEMAHDTRYVPFLVGLGVRKLSLDPVFLPDLQHALEAWSLEEARAYAEELLTLHSVREVDAKLRG